MQTQQHVILINRNGNNLWHFQYRKNKENQLGDFA